MTALLTSVRTMEEARDAAAAGADLIDLKEPARGALGALPEPVIHEIVYEVRRHWPALRLSATIGDLAPANHVADVSAMQHMADAIGHCGVDYVKVGIVPAAHARTALLALAGLPWQVVPVFLADAGIDLTLVEHACALGFPAVMADTADKQAGSLFDCVDTAVLSGMMRVARAHRVMVGLAGALRLEHLPQLRALAPDFAGFRSAICERERSSRLDAAKVRALRAGLSEPAPALLPA